MRDQPARAFVITSPLVAPTALADDGLPYEQRNHIGYGAVYGTGLLTGISTPNGKLNGIAIVNIVCGAWDSDHNKNVLAPLRCRRASKSKFLLIILALSAHCDPAVVVLCVEADMNGPLRKPCGTEALRTVLPAFHGLLPATRPRDLPPRTAVRKAILRADKLPRDPTFPP